MNVGKWVVSVFVGLAVVGTFHSSVAETGADLKLGGTVGITGGTSGFGGTFEMASPVNRMMSVGVETGGLLFSQSFSSGTTSATASTLSIPLLAVLTVRPERDELPVRPYLGIGAGLNVLVGFSSSNSERSTVQSEGVKILLQGVLKPGIEIPFGGGGASLFLEPKLGLLSDQFIFMPTVGLSLGL